MKKKGFTLVELLAVIAILAILVVFAMPNVIKMFEKSKKETFMNEVRSIYKDAKSKYMAAQMNGEDINFVTLNENDTKYCIILDNKGNPKKIAMSKNGYFIIKDTLSDINSIKEEDIHTGTMNMNDCNQSSFNSIEGTTSDGETIKVVSLSDEYKLSVVIRTGIQIGHIATWGIETKILDKNNNTAALNNPTFNVVKYVFSYSNDEAGQYEILDTVYSEIGSGNFSNIYTNVDSWPNDWGRTFYKIEAFINDESIGYRLIRSQCFVAGTKVKTENGFMNIEDIKIGDNVYSFNLDNNKHELKKVINTIKSKTIDTYKVTIGNKTVEMSPRHQVYIIDKGWVRAYDLVVGDSMLDINGNEVAISKIDYIKYNTPIDTYNLTIDGNSNYFVTDIQILVHNAAVGSTQGTLID